MITIIIKKEKTKNLSIHRTDLKCWFRFKPNNNSIVNFKIHAHMNMTKQGHTFHFKNAKITSSQNTRKKDPQWAPTLNLQILTKDPIYIMISAGENLGTSQIRIG